MSNPRKAYDFLEVFSGDGWVSKCMRTSGRATASFDIRLSPFVPDGKQNNMDILSDPGFAFCGCIINISGDVDIYTIYVLIIKVIYTNHQHAPSSSNIR